MAMKARDTMRVDVLRTTLAAVANAEAVGGATPDGPWQPGPSEVARRELTEVEVAAIVGAERDAASTAATEMRALGQFAEAERLALCAAVLTDLVEG